MQRRERAQSDLPVREGKRFAGYINFLVLNKQLETKSIYIVLPHRKERQYGQERERNKA